MFLAPPVYSAPHTAVLYNEKPEDDDDKAEESVCLPSQVQESSDAPVTDSSGSSYSSSNSTKGLLDGTQSIEANKSP